MNKNKTLRAKVLAAYEKVYVEVVNTHLAECKRAGKEETLDVGQLNIVREDQRRFAMMAEDYSLPEHEEKGRKTGVKT